MREILWFELKRILTKPWFYLVSLMLPLLIFLSVQIPNMLTKNIFSGLTFVLSGEKEICLEIKNQLEKMLLYKGKIYLEEAQGEKSEKVIRIEAEKEKATVFMEERNDVIESIVKKAVQAAYFIFKLQKRGFNIEEIKKLQKGIELNIVVPEKESTKTEGKFFVLLFIIIFYVGIMGFGDLLAHRVMIDKETNFLDILLLYRRPFQIFSGKLLAVVLSYFIYLSLTFSFSYLVLLLLRSNLPATILRIFLEESFFNRNLMEAFLIFFISYLMYSSFYLMVGSLANTEDDLKGYSQILHFILIVNLVFTIILLNVPPMKIEQILFYFPVSTPFLMLLKKLTGQLTVFESMIGTCIILATTFLFIFWSGAKYAVTSIERKKEVT